MSLFDGAELMRVLDAQRAARGLDWNQLAAELYEQSRVLNEELLDHSMCSGALVRTAKRGTMSCQYALTLLRWIRCAPEDFHRGPVIDVGDVRLPEAGLDERLHWDLNGLYLGLDQHRRGRQLTWVALAAELRCTPSRLTNLRTARLADMNLVMCVTQRVGRPAAEFVHATRW